MRICLVSQEYPPDSGHGGIATQTQLKAEGLAALGYEVQVLSHAGAAGPGTSQLGGATVTRIEGPDRRMPVLSEAMRWPAWSLEVAGALERLDANSGFDLVEFADYGAEGYAYLLNRAGRTRPAVVIHAQGPLAMLAQTIGWPAPDDPLSEVGRHMEGASLRLADAIYASSAVAAEWCLRAYGVDVTTVLHSGVDLVTFTPTDAARAGDTRAVLYVGRLAESKGVLDLVQAAAALAGRHPDLVLRLVGPVEARMRSQIEAIAVGAGLAVEMPGPVARERLTDAYRAADIFASPSHYESGPGFTFLEAMACGLPVIGPRGSGIAETVVDGESGLLVDPGDVASLSAALDALLADRERRRTMGALARRRAEAIGDRQAWVGAIARFLEGVASSRLVPA